MCSRFFTPIPTYKHPTSCLHTHSAPDIHTSHCLQTLAPDDDSPFLGALRPGQSRFTVTAGMVEPAGEQAHAMFRAPAAPYAPSPGDFLLVRRAGGGGGGGGGGGKGGSSGGGGGGSVYMLRELTGALAVGQQQPAMRVPQPDDAKVSDL